VLKQNPASAASEPQLGRFTGCRATDRHIPALFRYLRGKSGGSQRQRERYLAEMAPKLTARQQAQLGWLETLPPKLEKMKKIIELMSTSQADESQQRGLAKMLDELKAQAGGLGVTTLADSFGYMGMTMRRSGGHQTKVRGLREMLAGARINFEGALRNASIAEPGSGADDDMPVSP
jgi:hypothetical protein